MESYFMGPKPPAPVSKLTYHILDLFVFLLNNFVEFERDRFWNTGRNYRTVRALLALAVLWQLLLHFVAALILLLWLVGVFLLLLLGVAVLLLLSRHVALFALVMRRWECRRSPLRHIVVLLLLEAVLLLFALGRGYLVHLLLR